MPLCSFYCSWQRRRVPFLELECQLMKIVKTQSFSNVSRPEDRKPDGLAAAFPQIFVVPIICTQVSGTKVDECPIASKIMHE